MVKNLPAMQETKVGSLGWGNLLEKGMATHLPEEYCLENTKDKEAWRVIVHRVEKSRI